MLLTIAIPTYNRNTILHGNLAKLLTQLTSEVTLLIVDNASPTPVTLNEEERKSNADIRIVRNQFNIGGNGNILRCFELCSTEWIWILGDDDNVSPDAVSVVLEKIKLHSGMMFFNFGVIGGTTRSTDLITVGRLQLLEALKGIGEILFLSADIFKTSEVTRFIDFGFHFSYSCGPHVAMLLMAIKDQGKCFFSSSALVDWQRPVVENRGSLIPIALGLPSLLDLPMSETERLVLVRSLNRFPNISAVAHQLLLQVNFSGMKPKAARRTFRIIMKRVPGSWPYSRRIIGAVCSLMLFFPKSSYHLLVRPLYKKLTGHSTGKHKIGLERL